MQGIAVWSIAFISMGHLLLSTHCVCPVNLQITSAGDWVWVINPLSGVCMYSASFVTDSFYVTYRRDIFWSTDYCSSELVSKINFLLCRSRSLLFEFILMFFILKEVNDLYSTCHCEYANCGLQIVSENVDCLPI